MAESRHDVDAWGLPGALARTSYGGGMIECDNCHQPFEPVKTRWLCPHCKFKASCCEGEPQ